MKWMALMLALLTALATGQEDTRIVCTGCAGAGEALLECDLCGGDGKGPCSECVQDPRQEFFEHQEAFAEHVDSLAWLGFEEKDHLWSFLTPSFSWPEGSQHRVSAGAGFLRCPVRSSLRKDSHRATCKLCSGKERIKCKHCRGKAETKCTACAGRKERMQTCLQCIGSGRSFELGAAVERCPWCEGAGLLECLACEEGKREAECLNCSGVGEHLCRVCRGTKQEVCLECRGAGKSGSGAGKCKPCKGKGFLKCELPNPARCGECKTRGRVEEHCRHCFGSRLAPCNGCWGGRGEGWLVEAERLAGRGEQELAVKYYAHGLGREEARAKKEIKKQKGDARDQAEASRKERLSLLRSRQAKLGKQ